MWDPLEGRFNGQRALRGRAKPQLLVAAAHPLEPPRRAASASVPRDFRAARAPRAARGARARNQRGQQGRLGQYQRQAWNTTTRPAVAGAAAAVAAALSHTMRRLGIILEYESNGEEFTKPVDLLGLTPECAPPSNPDTPPMCPGW